MNICFMCDLHLPFDKNALQYDVLEWAISDIKRKNPACIIYAGDVTCDGNIQTYLEFINKIQSIGVPFIYIPGNSDLRDSESCNEIHKNSSLCENDIDRIKIFAVNDSNGEISDEQFSTIEKADDSSIVFLHHPMHSLSNSSREKFLKWRENHKNTSVFYGHLHESVIDGASISLQAMDPDKAIGESPCITYYNTETKEIRKAYYFSPVPKDFYNNFGISCYDTIGHIEFAIENGIKNIELRPSCISTEQNLLIEYIEKWRKNGGENLCIHLPDISYNDGDIEWGSIEKFIELSILLGVDRLTQHVPLVSVNTVRTDHLALDRICDCLAETFNTIDKAIVIGIENMHMTANEKADDSRRFGYTPEECIEIMNLLAKKCKHKVGINFDFGHARNNAPYSQKYQISTWLSQIGQYVVGYHAHQVTLESGKFENHMPITDIYGKLISYASFFKYWSKEMVAKAPIIFEMRPENAYEETLKTFNKEKMRNVFDVHTHTNYSWCGHDDPRELIEKAIENGISILGISDHNYGIGERKAEYFERMRSLANEYKDKIKILCGIEISTLPQFFDIKDTAEIKDYDYCLLEHITSPDSIAGTDLFAFCKNLGIVCGIAHTDLFKYCEMYNYDYTEFFKRMAEENIFFELNVSYDSIHKYAERQYVKDFIKDKNKIEIIKNAGVCVSVGSDCHLAEEYNGFKLYETYDFLKANNIKTIDELL